MYSIIYLIFELLYKLYDKFIAKEFTQFYIFSKDKSMLKFKSDIKEFSSDFLMTIFLNGKTKEFKAPYNNYMDNEGYVM